MSAAERMIHVASTSSRGARQEHCQLGHSYTFPREALSSRCPPGRSRRSRPAVVTLVHTAQHRAAAINGLHPVGQISGAGAVTSVQMLPRVRLPSSKSDAGPESLAQTALAVGVLALAAVQGANLAGSLSTAALRRLRSARLPAANARSALKALEAGFAQPLAGGFEPHPDVLIERTELLSRILRAMEEPRESTSLYHLVSGASGVGKTTIVRQAVARLGGGYILVEAPTVSERDLVKPLLTQALEAALGITPAHADADADTRFRACVAELERAAAALNARGTLLSARAGGAGGAAAAGGAPHAPPRLPAPRPPVLVIDEADRLLLDEGFVGVLQELAKGWADAGLIRVFFVTCGGRLPALMKDHTSGWTRANESLAVPGMGRDEAIQFLRAHKMWRPEGEQPDLRFEFDLGEIVELLGDRPVQLLAASRALVSGESTLEGVIESCIEGMQLRFAKAGLMPWNSEENKPVINVLLHLCELQDAGGMPLRDFTTRLGHDLGMLKKLCECQIVSLVPGALTPTLTARGGSAVVLESRAVQYFLRVM